MLAKGMAGEIDGSWQVRYRQLPNSKFKVQKQKPHCVRRLAIVNAWTSQQMAISALFL
jgi:hypothetical protein